MSDRRILLMLGGIMVVLLVGVSVFAGDSSEDDPRPTTYNTRSAGAAAAYQTLEALHHPVARWDRPLADLRSVAAEQTTLVLAEPQINPLTARAEGEDLKRFLERGGHVLLTGSTWATLLPEGRVAPPTIFKTELCFTTPEGPGALAAAGEVEMGDWGRWAASGPQFRVEQRCNNDSVVVRFPVGKGEAVWWSSSTPLSNAGLKKEPNLRLLLASLYGRGGETRNVLFDQYLQDLHGEHRDLTRGLPLRWLGVQLAMIFALVVFSFSRRKGPMRLPPELPRSSPVEFAASMGELYARAGATSAAIDAARRSLMRQLGREAGVSREALAGGPDAIAASLRTRFGGDWTSLAAHLRQASEADDTPRSLRGTLLLVRSLGEDGERIRAALHPGKTVVRDVAKEPEVTTGAR